MLSDSDSEDVTQLTINEHFAKAYEYRKEREELQKLKDKYGSDAEEGDEDDEEDSEEMESEDEDGEELTPAVDAAIFRTLARIKRRDPAIYDVDKGVFEEERQRTDAAKAAKRQRTDKDKSKPVTLRQQAIDAVLNPTDSRSPSPQPLTHVEEQRALRDETITAFHRAVDVDADAEDAASEEDDLLLPRAKTKDELDQDEEEYREFLRREVGEDLSALVTVEREDGKGAEEEEATAVEESPKEKRKKDKKKDKKKGRTKSRQDDDQEFLMNYILNRGWIDRSARRVPTYEEVTGSRNGKGKANEEASDDDQPDVDHDAPHGETPLLEDEEFEDVADHFESSYNFRFEEPDAATIKRYPRDLHSTVRREDTTRKDAREKRKTRKEEELAKKREEVKRLKALKMKELRAKLERIGREGGRDVDEDEALRVLDLDAEWDPSAHDRQMAELYGADEASADADADADALLDADMEKPQWDDDIGIDDIMPAEASSSGDKKKKKKKKKKDADGAPDAGVDLDAMDADVEMEVDEEEWDGTEEMRKRVLDKYMDEIYGLEFNDMVGDLPTRFKYTPVQPDTYALTPAEILVATDAELNQYVGLKTYAPYRAGRRWDVARNERLKDFKRAVEARGADVSWGKGGGDGEKERPQKKRKGKKERMKAKATAGPEDGEEGDDGALGASASVEADGEGNSSRAEGPKKKRRRQH